MSNEKRQTPADIINIVLPPNTGMLAVMNMTGDKKTTWNRGDTVEVEAARKEFDFFKGKGYMAYKVDKGDDRAEVINTFDPAYEKIIFAPPMRGGSARTALVLPLTVLALSAQTGALHKESIPLTGGSPIRLEVGPSKKTVVTIPNVRKSDIAGVLAVFFSKEDKKSEVRIRAVLEQADELTFVMTSGK